MTAKGFDCVTLVLDENLPARRAAGRAKRD